jgi:pentatricopeptide repeat protein
MKGGGVCVCVCGGGGALRLLGFPNCVGVLRVAGLSVCVCFGPQFYGEPHPVVASSWNALALALARLGEMEEAVACFQRAIAGLTPSLPPGLCQ